MARHHAPYSTAQAECTAVLVGSSSALSARAHRAGVSEPFGKRQPVDPGDISLITGGIACAPFMRDRRPEVNVQRFVKKVQIGCHSVTALPSLPERIAQADGVVTAKAAARDVAIGSTGTFRAMCHAAKGKVFNTAAINNLGGVAQPDGHQF